MSKKPPAASPDEPPYKSFVTMTFKVEPDFRKRIRLEAASRDQSLKALLEDMLALWIKTNGGTRAAPRKDLLKTEFSGKSTRR